MMTEIVHPSAPGNHPPVEMPRGMTDCPVCRKPFEGTTVCHGRYAWRPRKEGQTLHGATRQEQDAETIEKLTAGAAVLRERLLAAYPACGYDVTMQGREEIGRIHAKGCVRCGLLDLLTNPEPAIPRLLAEAALGRAYFEASGRPEIHTNGDVARAVSKAVVALMDLIKAQGVTA